MIAVSESRDNSQQRRTNLGAGKYFHYTSGRTVVVPPLVSNADIRVSHHKNIEKLPFQANNKLTKKMAILV